MTSTIAGYAAKYNTATSIGGVFLEKLAPGCFARSLRENPDVRALLAHDDGRVLGRVSAGTLRLKDDSLGLWFAVDADPSTPSGAEAIGTVGRQDVKGCSFGFIVNAETWSDDGSNLPLRTITDAELFEISLVGDPAYSSTTASLVRKAAPRKKPPSFSARRAEAAMRMRGLAV